MGDSPSTSRPPQYGYPGKIAGGGGGGTRFGPPTDYEKGYAKGYTPSVSAFSRVHGTAHLNDHNGFGPGPGQYGDDWAHQGIGYK